MGGGPSDRFHPVRPAASLAELRLSVGHSTARSYAFSVSTENGIQLAVSLRQRWDRNVPDSLQGGGGSDGAFREALASISAFRGVRGPGYSNHVVAFRGAIGIADGPGSGRGHFSVGGGAGAGVGVLGIALGDGPRQFPVRGLSDGDDRGNKAWSMTAEWRFPVALIHSGLGARPFYLDRIAGSLFVDVAGTGREVSGSVQRWRTLSSLGAELVFFGALLFEEVDPECAWVWLCRLKGRKGAPIALPCTCKQGGLFRHEEHIAKSLDLLHVVSYSEIVPIFCGGGSGFSTLQSAWHHSFCRLSTTCRWQSTLFPQGLPHT